MTNSLKMMLPSWLRSLAVFFLLIRHVQGQRENGETGEELAIIYEDALRLFNVFPPIDPNPSIWEGSNIRPIEVVAANIIISVDDIAPGSSEFTVTTRTVMYWKKEDCNQTMTHQMACDTRLSGDNGFRFLSQENAKSLPRVSLALTIPNMHQTVFEDQDQSDIQPDAELVESTTTYKQVSPDLLVDIVEKKQKPSQVCCPITSSLTC
jgi:hypothetical protein